MKPFRQNDSLELDEDGLHLREAGFDWKQSRNRLEKEKQGARNAKIQLRSIEEVKINPFKFDLDEVDSAKSKEVENAPIEPNLVKIEKLANAHQPRMGNSLTNHMQSKKDIKLLAQNIKYCGPSPDEISLLSSCKDICRFFFIGADSKRVVIQAPNLKFEVEKVISNEFESERKMMSVLIKHNGKGGLTRTAHVQRSRRGHFITFEQANLRARSGPKFDLYEGNYSAADEAVHAEGISRTAHGDSVSVAEGAEVF